MHCIGAMHAMMAYGPGGERHRGHTAKAFGRTGEFHSVGEVS